MRSGVYRPACGPMSEPIITVGGRELAAPFEVTVRTPRYLTVQEWVGLCCIRLGAWLAGLRGGRVGGA